MRRSRKGCLTPGPSLQGPRRDAPSRSHVCLRLACVRCSAATVCPGEATRDLTQGETRRRRGQRWEGPGERVSLGQSRWCLVLDGRTQTPSGHQERRCRVLLAGHWPLLPFPPGTSPSSHRLRVSLCGAWAGLTAGTQRPAPCPMKARVRAVPRGPGEGGRVSSQEAGSPGRRAEPGSQVAGAAPGSGL